MAEYNAGSIEADLLLNREPFDAGLEAAKSEAKAMEDKPIEVPIEAKPDDASFFGAHAALQALATGDPISIKATVDQALLLHSWPRAALNALASSMGADMGAIMGAATKKQLIQAILMSDQAGGGGGSLGTILAGGGGGGGGEGPIIPVAGGAGDGGGGSFHEALPQPPNGRDRRGPLGGLLAGGGLAALLGFGSAAGPLGLAGMGSLGSFAGFGLEHLIMTGVGLAGNAAGGLLGGGLLGAGAAGTMAVGMGTDLAGMGQAAGDIKAVYGAQNQLNQAIAVYGARSQQAAQAQAQLNATLAGFSPVARGAVLSAANTAQQFHQLFNQATGQAEKVGAEIIQQAMQVGEKFLPTIGRYAAENMGIIRQSLQPLFAWMQGPGLTIFNQLEKKFQQDLPTAMNAFVNGIELLMRTIGFLSPMTGGLIRTIDKLVTRFNTTGWSQWTNGIQHLVDDFRNWEALIKVLISDIYLLFHADAGTATGIVQSLTQMLQKLHDWEASTRGQASMHNLFTTHKKEILELLQLIPPLITAFGKIELAVAPQMTSLMGDLLQFVNTILRIPTVGPLLAWAGALGIIGSRIGAFKAISAIATMTGLDTALVNFGKALGLIAYDAAAAGLKAVAGGIASLARFAWGAIVAGVRGLAGAWTALDIAMDANLIGLIVLGIIALGAGIYELVKHFKQVSDFLNGPWGTAISVAVAGFAPLIGIPMLIIGHWRGVVGFFKDVWHNLQKSAGDFVSSFENMPSQIIGAWHSVVKFFEGLPKDIEGAWNGLVAWFKQRGRDIVNGFMDAVHSVWNSRLNTFTNMHNDVQKATAGSITWLKKAGQDVTHGFFEGSKAGWTIVLKWLPNMEKDLLHTFRGSDGWLKTSGHSIIAGLLSGVTQGWPLVQRWLPTIRNDIVNSNKGAVKWLHPAGQSTMTGLWNGLREGWNAAYHWVPTIQRDIITFFASAGHWLIQAGIAIITGLWAGIRQEFPGVAGWFHSLPGWIEGFVSGAGNWLIDAGNRLLQGMLNGIHTAWGDVSGWFGGLPGRIKDMLGGAGGWLIGIGASIVHGLANGIRGAVGDVTSAVASVIGSVTSAGGIIGMAKKALGMNSPSRVFHDIGLGVGEGLTNGIVASRDKVTGAGADLAYSAVTGAKGVRMPLLGKGIGAHTNGDIRIEINAPLVSVMGSLDSATMPQVHESISHAFTVLTAELQAS